MGSITSLVIYSTWDTQREYWPQIQKFIFTPHHAMNGSPISQPACGGKNPARKDYLTLQALTVSQGSIGLSLYSLASLSTVLSRSDWALYPHSCDEAGSGSTSKLEFSSVCCVFVGFTVCHWKFQIFRWCYDGAFCNGLFGTPPRQCALKDGFTRQKSKNRSAKVC